MESAEHLLPFEPDRMGLGRGLINYRMTIGTIADILFFLWIF